MYNYITTDSLTLSVGTRVFSLTLKTLTLKSNGGRATQISIGVVHKLGCRIMTPSDVDSRPTITYKEYIYIVQLCTHKSPSPLLSICTPFLNWMRSVDVAWNGFFIRNCRTHIEDATMFTPRSSQDGRVSDYFSPVFCINIFFIDVIDSKTPLATYVNPPFFILSPLQHT